MARAHRRTSITTAAFCEVSLSRLKQASSYAVHDLAKINKNKTLWSAEQIGINRKHVTRIAKHQYT
jgi:hypothetical protein